MLLCFGAGSFSVLLCLCCVALDSLSLVSLVWVCVLCWCFAVFVLLRVVMVCVACCFVLVCC